jgi:hypothetical protein
VHALGGLGRTECSWQLHHRAPAGLDDFTASRPLFSDFMGLQGYVGSADDQARIRRLERERDEERKRIEDARKASASQPAGFRQWKQGSMVATDLAFKKETVGLVSRDEYIERRATIQARLEVCIDPLIAHSPVSPGSYACAHSPDILN